MEIFDGVKDFVERLYQDILGRKADASGLQAWTDVLRSGSEQGAKVAQGFIDSIEFKNRSLSDKEYLTILYHTFFNRQPDASGLPGLAECTGQWSYAHACIPWLCRIG